MQSPGHPSCHCAVVSSGIGCAAEIHPSAACVVYPRFGEQTVPDLWHSVSDAFAVWGGRPMGVRFVAEVLQPLHVLCWCWGHAFSCKMDTEGVGGEVGTWRGRGGGIDSVTFHCH